MSVPTPTKTKTIKLDSLVLVTGVNGYLGLHIADQLLLAGYKVRGTVRDAVRCSWTKDYFDVKYGIGEFEIVVVDDMAREGAFDESMVGELHSMSLLSPKLLHQINKSGEVAI